MPIQKRISGEELVERAHINELILKNKVLMPILAGLLSFAAVGELTDNRAAYLLPPGLTIGWLYAETASTSKKVRRCQALKGEWREQASKEVQEYMDALGGAANATVAELTVALPTDGDEDKKNKKTNKGSHNRGRGNSGGSMPPMGKPKNSPLPGGKPKGVESGPLSGLMDGLKGLGGKKNSKPAIPVVPMGGDTPVKKSQVDSKPKPVIPTMAGAVAPISPKSKPPIKLPPKPDTPEPVAIEGSSLLKGAPILGDQQHLGVCGPTRSGKTQTAYTLLGHKENVTYVSIKYNDKIPTHWDGYLLTRDGRVDQLNYLLDKWFIEYDEYCQGVHTGEKWWVIDEALAIMSNLQSIGTKEGTAAAKRLKNFIVELSSVGMNVGCKIALLSQSPNCSDLGISGPIMKNLTWVVPGSSASGFGHVVNDFPKLSGKKLSKREANIVSNLTGYHQLWLWRGNAVLGSIKPIEFELKDLELVKVPEVV